jgi:hypothetical protein
LAPKTNDRRPLQQSNPSVASRDVWNRFRCCQHPKVNLKLPVADDACLANECRELSEWDDAEMVRWHYV